MHMYEAIGVWPLGTGKPMFGRPTHVPVRVRMQTIHDR